MAGGIASSRFLIVIGEIGAPRIFLCPICEKMYLLGSFNLQKKYLNEGELTAHMNDNFETPCRQLFGQPWDIFMKTLTQLCNNFERGVYLCPALWVVYSHSLHQKKTLIDLRLISKPPFSEETAWHQGFYWGPPPCLAIGHQALGTVAQIGRWGRGISLTPLIGGSVQT